MMKFDLILPLDSVNGEQTYLIPCMLPPLNINIYENEPFQKMQLTYSTIHSTSIGDTLPIGTFHRLLSECAKHSSWKLCIDDHLSYNDASFEVTEDTRLVLTLMKNNTIRVSLWTSKNDLNKGLISNEEIREIIFKIRNDLARKMEVFDIAQSKDFQMICPHWRPGDENLCLVKVEEKMEAQTDELIFYPRADKYLLHKKALARSFFLWRAEDWNGKKNFKCIA